MSRVVLVTGGAKGIGLACAQAFVAAGDRVAVTYRSAPPEGADAEGLLCVACDVTDSDQVDAAFATIEEALGPVEVLVANAGITNDMLVLRMDEDAFSSVVDTNLTGGFRLARRAVQKMMRARFGRIIFISSVVASTGPGRAGQLLGVEGRPRRPGPLAGPRVRLAEDHRERGRARARSPPT